MIHFEHACVIAMCADLPAARELLLTGSACNTCFVPHTEMGDITATAPMRTWANMEAKRCDHPPICVLLSLSFSALPSLSFSVLLSLFFSVLLSVSFSVLPLLSFSVLALLFFSVLLSLPFSALHLLSITALLSLYFSVLLSLSLSVTPLIPFSCSPPCLPTQRRVDRAQGRTGRRNSWRCVQNCATIGHQPGCVKRISYSARGHERHRPR